MPLLDVEAAAGCLRKLGHSQAVSCGVSTLGLGAEQQQEP
eukprot:CAMPEP_0180700770 /NCGR_PEP_ID=MMETSP1038_2-20121128/5251_1 /TAXON_ID=632150 /ORGANISM="Azadinium spinosum, Strain 3D9" /LENGTH=39 /DNA_ID= /DNA_START= /DNA_END= /DNA_ORIENTATION=